MKKLLSFIISIFIILACGILNVGASGFLADKTETVYNNKNGLLTAKANAICQTEDGHIWIGQYAGLTKYDSKNFILISEYNEFNLTGVTALAAIGNNLFIGTQNGLFLKNDEDIISEFKTDHETISIKDIKTFNNTAFIATNKGLYRFKLGEDKLHSLTTRNVINVYPYDDNNCFYVADSTAWGTLSSGGDLSIDKNYSIKAVCFKNNVLYFGTTDGKLLKLSNFTESDLTEVSTGMGAINDIILHGEDLFIATDHGFYIVDKNDNCQNISNLNVSKNIQRIMVDYEDNIWIASNSDGVSKITQNELSDYFTSFDLNLHDEINAIEEYNGLIYVAGTKGIRVFDEKNNTDLPEHILDYYLYNVRIRDLEVYKDKLYIATYDTDIFDLIVYDYKTNSIESISADMLVSDGGSVKSAGQIRCFTKADGYLYIGTNDGISRYDGETFVNRKLYNRPLYMYHNENSDRLYLVLEDLGLNYIDSANYITDISPELNSALKCLYVNDCLLFNNNSKLYIYKDNEIKQINYEFVGSIVEILYLNNKYIIGTDTNIYITDDIFNDKPVFKILDSANGLYGSLTANATGYYNPSTKNYYFASTEGVYLYNLDNASHKKVSRKISIEGIYADDYLIEGKNIRLSSDVNRLSIQFSVLSFVNDKHYNIYYKLDGVDSDYRQMSSSDNYKIDYTNIKGGNYNISIYTEDLDGTRSFNTISLNITKDKKIYEEAWFWVIITILVIIVIILVNFFIISIKNKSAKKRENELKGITIESIEAIARTIDVKDSYTNGHSIRVGHFSRIIGKELGIEGENLDNLYYIALLHDIGKIGIPDAILNKPGKLTDEEFAIMKSHTTKGAKILADISTIPNIVEGAKYHHERYGGGGYPEGLKGEEIPYIARIICCADCYDAMATRRVYKDPYPKEKIIDEFEKCKNTQFDPKIADVVIKLIKEGKLFPNE